MQDSPSHLRDRMRTLIWPLTLPYRLILWLRHWLYDHGIFRSVKPSVPTIVVGNLALGGTGKTPHVELILRELQDRMPIATLSRGYGRKSKGHREVLTEDHPSITGDEPLQLKRKFPAVRVFVNADRIAGIEKIKSTIQGVRAIVLDDAFQHRQMQGDLNILLTTYQRPWHRDLLIPAGRLRDLPAQRKRAQIVIVTKCPSLPSDHDREQWRKDLGLVGEQELFFSGIEYDPIEDLSSKDILLVTGIADPQPLVDHLRSRARKLEHLAYPDHHDFTPGDLQQIAGRFGKFAPGPKMLVTTGKDAVRLRPLMKNGPLSGVPLQVIGMRAIILDRPRHFGELIQAYVGKDKADRATA